MSLDCDNALLQHVDQIIFSDENKYTKNTVTRNLLRLTSHGDVLLSISLHTCSTKLFLVLQFQREMQLFPTSSHKDITYTVIKREYTLNTTKRLEVLLRPDSFNQTVRIFLLKVTLAFRTRAQR